MTKIEHRSPTIGNEGKIKFNKFELKMDTNVRVMWITFQHYATKGQIEMDVTFARSTTKKKMM